ncbi:MAG: glucose-6-phosphate isomerase [Candidatus Omnitrophica bacterium]|nr:glucose-6-phosphate isomerase [Candidatus Omnitrophota bacterium]
MASSHPSPQSTLERLAAERVISRLWQQDASLWSADPSVQATIRQRLGWLTIQPVMSQRLQEIRQTADDIRRAGVTHTVLLGMGGSGLFPEVCRNIFGLDQPGTEFTVLDTTDPTAIRQALAQCNPQRLLIIISSKSGSTNEILALSKYFICVFQQAGLAPGEHCLVVTDAGSALEASAKAWHARNLFVHGPGTGAEVGGRFSALTYFGLVPAALMGIDVERLLQRAAAMFARCDAAVPVAEHPAAKLAATLGAFAQQGRPLVTLLCHPALASFGVWVEQLLAESTGKQGRGMTPMTGEPRREPSLRGADRVFVELQLAPEPDRELERYSAALERDGHPVVRLRWDDPYDVMGEAVKWFFATAIMGYLLGVNPFDEPNVQESKDRTKALLEQFAKDGQLRDDGQLLCMDGNLSVFGARELAASSSLTGCFSAFFRRHRPHDYVSLLSFLPRTAALDEGLMRLRERLGASLQCATMLQFGPRYLHSTGQLFKGGPDAGVFLLLTAEERQDLAIPGEPFTFGVLKQAQALGDFQAMQQRGRRILRIHMRGTLEHALSRVMAAVDEAIVSLRSAPVSRT